jgi:hypothetical protein
MENNAPASGSMSLWPAFPGQADEGAKSFGDDKTRLFPGVGLCREVTTVNNFGNGPGAAERCFINTSFCNA